MLISLINAVGSEKDQVKDIEVRNPYTQKGNVGSTFAVLDITAQATNGTFYNIEVQVKEDLHHDKRSLYYFRAADFRGKLCRPSKNSRDLTRAERYTKSTLALSRNERIRHKNLKREFGTIFQA